MLSGIETRGLTHADAEIQVTELADGRRRISVQARRPGLYVHVPSCVTEYPTEILRLILDAKGPGYLCDEVLREQDPGYVRAHLAATIRAHVDPAELAGGAVLDFGCGAGASTMILASVLSGCRITGLDLYEKNLAVARARARWRGYPDVSFRLSARGDAVPSGLGEFDAVILSAVFEHLLPHERRTLLPQLWAVLRKGGTLFVDETPNRWFPFESHTTGLPLLNYLPDRLALATARRFSHRVRPEASWPELLRDGVRGGTTGEILRAIRAGGGRPRLVSPAREGVHDPVELWRIGYLSRGGARAGRLKHSWVGLQKLTHGCTGVALVPYLSLCIRKDG